MSITVAAPGLPDNPEFRKGAPQSWLHLHPRYLGAGRGRGCYKRAALHRAGQAWLPTSSGAQIRSDPPAGEKGPFGGQEVRLARQLTPTPEGRGGGWGGGLESWF